MKKTTHKEIVIDIVLNDILEILLTPVLWVIFFQNIVNKISWTLVFWFREWK